MGHLSEAKGFYDLLEAAELILRERKDIRFMFAGERLDVERNVSTASSRPVDWSKVDQLMKRYPELIRLVGVVSGHEKDRFFKESDLFVFPSYAEAFPVVILEAMAAGLPLVMTPVGALPEVLTEGENGLFVSPGDVQSLKAALLALVNDPARRDRMGKNNLKKVERFSPGAMASAVGRIFHEVIARKKMDNE